MDVPEAPKVVLAQPAPCTDASQAAEVLRTGLAQSRAPREGWTVTIRFSRTDAHLTVDGEITNEDDEPVAERTLESGAAACSSLARAIGVWAALVLDAEVERASAAPPPAPTAPTDAPPPAPRPRPPESGTPGVRAAQKRGLEMGATGFMATGTGARVVAGPSVFASFEVVPGLYLRPALSVARTIDPSTASGPIEATWGAGRLDACGSLPAARLGGHRIQADVCVGAEVGYMQFDPASTALPAGSAPASVAGRGFAVFAVGPSLGVRLDLGDSLSTLIRGVGELDVLRDGIADPGVGPRTAGLFVGRGEIGLSWRFR